jgi:hypothetical protein
MDHKITNLVEKFIRKESGVFEQRPARKYFFFEKKKQKTFVCAAHIRGSREQPLGVE